MQHDWIIDVLTDLAAFAQQNGMAALAEQLEDSKLIAAGELAAARHGAPGRAAGDAAATLGFHRAVAGGGEP
ncbi:MAG: hypothetical protein IT545_14620 [Rhodobacteraceae bacterium]|nr:hypothetical protein [Paracoccaceae bacterium]